MVVCDRQEMGFTVVGILMVVCDRQEMGFTVVGILMVVCDRQEMGFTVVGILMVVCERQKLGITVVGILQDARTYRLVGRVAGRPLEKDRSGFHSHFAVDLFPKPIDTSDFNSGAPMATLPGDLSYSAKTGRPIVSKRVTG